MRLGVQAPFPVHPGLALPASFTRALARPPQAAELEVPGVDVRGDDPSAWRPGSGRWSHVSEIL